MKTAVCVMIQNSDHYLAVSRRGDATKWGFPGGKVDELDTNVGAAKRETFEEIGLTFGEHKLSPLYSGFCPGEVNFWVTTYVLTAAPVQMAELRMEEGLVASWLTESELCNPVMSPFADYNMKAFASFHQRFPDGVTYGHRP